MIQKYCLLFLAALTIMCGIICIVFGADILVNGLWLTGIIWVFVGGASFFLGFVGFVEILKL